MHDTDGADSPLLAASATVPALIAALMLHGPRDRAHGNPRRGRA